jgi:hypothetical protein
VCGDAGAGAQQASRIDRAFQKFWAAPTSEEALKVIGEIVETKVTLAEAIRRLKQGRPYRPQKSGIVRMVNEIEGTAYHYTVHVPVGYNPARRYPVRIHLHGDVYGKPPQDGRAEIRPFADARQFNVVPTAWGTNPWWSDDQIQNLRMILDKLKRRYNIDENRVVLAGVSDGGTGVYYMAMRDPTPYAAFLPINAFILVLGNEGLALNEHLFPNNLRNRSLLAINGDDDPIYPTSQVEPTIDHMKQNGVAIDFHPQRKAGHDIRWWPSMKATIEKWVAGHPRDPVPDSVTWQMADNNIGNRAHWLIVDEVTEPPAEEQDALAAQPGQSRFAPKRGAPNPFPLFAFQQPSGRVDGVRKGNRVDITAEGLDEVTILLSPDRIDFEKPVTIAVNDVVIFEDVMVPSVGMLLKWAAIDNDRTMLYAVQFRVRIEA